MNKEPKTCEDCGKPKCTYGSCGASPCKYPLEMSRAIKSYCHGDCKPKTLEENDDYETRALREMIRASHDSDIFYAEAYLIDYVMMRKAKWESQTEQDTIDRCLKAVKNAVGDDEMGARAVWCACVESVKSLKSMK
ncbi:MAG: hypothetical protein JRL30_25925 [Deltaproteobacteria bacterium]|nr:hypothetical protein [Deltaproteobacteria bacterium]